MQFLTSIAYFSEHLDLFSAQGPDFRDDIHEYLRRNLFEPGILRQAIHDNPACLSIFDNFISKALMRFNLDTINEGYFYQLQADVYSYVLALDENENTELIALKDTIRKKQKATLDKIEKIQLSELTPYEQYRIERIKLQLYLETYSELELNNEDNAKKLFDLYISFCNMGRRIKFDSTEEGDKHQKLTDISIKKLQIHEDSVYKWALEFCPEDKRTLLTKKGKYPYFYGIDPDGKSFLSMDLPQGAIILDGTFRCYSTKEMMASSLCVEALEKRNPEFFVSIATDPYYGLIKQYEMIGVKPRERFLELKTDKATNYKFEYAYKILDDNNKFIPAKVKPNTLYLSEGSYVVMDPNGVIQSGSLSKDYTASLRYNLENSAFQRSILSITSSRKHTLPLVPWIYQKELQIKGKTQFFEQQFFSTSETFAPITLSVRPNLHDTQSLNIQLPEYFHGKETKFWVSLDKKELVIQQGNKNFLLNESEDFIQELDCNNNATGFILNTSFDQNKSLISVFETFESPDFIQFLYQNKSPPEEIKINFLRYGLELIGFFNKKENKWVIHIKDRPELILVNDSNIPIKSIMPNALIFEEVGKNVQFALSPSQPFMVNDAEQKDYKEKDFPTLYHLMKLDDVNSHKFTEQKLYDTESRKTFPKGNISYANTENYFTYTVTPLTQDAKFESTEAGLYLAYLNLIHFKPEAAFAVIQKISKSGGLKGTEEELELIFRIMECLPDHQKQINSPAFIAVKTYVLSLCMELGDKEFTIKESTKEHTPDGAVRKKHELVLRGFRSSLPILALHFLDRNYQTRNNIPAELHLPLADEYRMLLRCKRLATIPLKARELQLKRMQLTEEYESLKQTIKTEDLTPKQQQRIAQLERNLNEFITETYSTFSIGPKTEKIKLDEKCRFLSYENKRLIKNSIHNSKNLRIHPSMSETKFLKNFKTIYEIARNPLHSSHAELKDFLINTLKANLELLRSEDLKNDEINPIVFSAPTLLVIMNNPKNFHKPGCGLIKMSHVPSLKKIENYLKNKNLIIAVDKELYYADKEKKTIEKIPTPSKEDYKFYHFEVLQKVCSSSYKNADSSQFNHIEGLTGQVQNLDLRRRYRNSINAIFKEAHSIYSEIDLNVIDVITTQAQFDITPAKQSKIFKPLSITINDSLYQTVSLEAFVEKMGLKTLADQIKAQKQNNLKQIENLKAQLEHDAQGKKADVVKLLRDQCDEKIGQIRNKETLDIQHLVGKSALALLSTNPVNELIGTCTKTSDALLKDALALANKGPTNPKLRNQYHLELEGKTRKVLTLTDLNRLFVLADFNEYHNATGLDNEEDIQALHNTLAQYINYSILKTQYEKIKKGIEELNQDPKNVTKINKLSQEVFARNSVPLHDSALQFFQKEEGILIREEQYFYLKKLLSKSNFTKSFINEVIQIGMGGGKSKVLAPIAALKKANGTNLVIQQVKSSLLELHYADAHEKSQRLFNKKPFLLKFERKPISFSKNSAEEYEFLFESLNQCVAERNFVVTSGPILQSIQLQYFDILAHKPKNKGELEEWNKQVGYLRNVLLLLRARGDRIIDEVHDELDPTKKLNFIVGESISAPSAQIKLCSNFFFFLNEIDVTAILNLKSQTKMVNLILDNTLMTKPEVQMPELMKAIALNLVHETNQDNVSNPLRLILDKLQLSKEQKQKLVDYLLNQDDAIKSLLDEKLNKSELDILVYIKLQLSNILPFTLTQTYNKDFGPTRELGVTELKKKLAIPYSAINTPNEKDRFGQFEVGQNLTIQMNIIEPLSKELIIELIQDYLAKAREELGNTSHGDLDKTSNGKEFNELFGKHLNTTLSSLSDLTKFDHNAFYKFVQNSQSSIPFKKAVLEEKIVPLVKLNPLVYSSNSHDLFEMTNTTQAKSGTPVNFRAYHPNLKYQEMENLGTDGETIDLLKKKNTQVLVCPQYNSAVKVLHHALEQKINNYKNIRAIIDVGGLFKDEVSNLVCPGES